MSALSISQGTDDNEVLTIGTIIKAYFFINPI